MDFFEKLGNTLCNTGKDISKKAKDISDISKLNHEITKQQETINKTYTQIGKIYFGNYADLDYGDLKELCDSIKEANQKIDSFKTEIIQIKGVINCPNCNKEVSSTAAFCASCGCKLKEDVAEIAENAPSSDEQIKENTEVVSNTETSIHTESTNSVNNEISETNN